MLTKGLQQTIPSHGYITTRVLLPQQDLSSGTLKFALAPGVVRAIRFADPATRGTWKSAFPSRDGDMLNLRELEPGLEQMKRVSSQDVDMKIEPADVPGESDVVITVKRAKPWSVVASVDNSGTRATGKLQGNLMGAGVVASIPAFWALPPKLLTGASAAGGIALINTLGQLGGIVSPIMVGRVKDLTGSTTLALYLIGAMSLMCALIMLFGMPESLRRRDGAV